MLFRAVFHPSRQNQERAPRVCLLWSPPFELVVHRYNPSSCERRVRKIARITTIYSNLQKTVPFKIVIPEEALPSLALTMCHFLDSVVWLLPDALIEGPAREGPNSLRFGRHKGQLGPVGGIQDHQGGNPRPTPLKAEVHHLRSGPHPKGFLALPCLFEGHAGHAQGPGPCHRLGLGPIRRDVDQCHGRARIVRRLRKPLQRRLEGGAHGTPARGKIQGHPLAGQVLGELFGFEEGRQRGQGGFGGGHVPGDVGSTRSRLGTRMERPGEECHRSLVPFRHSHKSKKQQRGKPATPTGEHLDRRRFCWVVAKSVSNERTMPRESTAGKFNGWMNSGKCKPPL